MHYGMDTLAPALVALFIASRVFQQPVLLLDCVALQHPPFALLRAVVLHA